MRILTLILLLIFTRPSYAEEFCILIDKFSGEVISTIPVTDNWEPNTNELKNMYVVIMDITLEEGHTLLKINENGGLKENKIDLNKVKNLSTKEKVSENLKNEIFTDIANKSIVVNP